LYQSGAFSLILYFNVAIKTFSFLASFFWHKTNSFAVNVSDFRRNCIQIDHLQHASLKNSFANTLKLMVGLLPSLLSVVLLSILSKIISNFTIVI
jgi:hypothetical protein